MPTPTASSRRSTRSSARSPAPDSAGRGAAGLAQRLDRGQLLVELGPGGVDVGRLEIQLASDLVDRAGLGRRDRAVGRPDREAAAQELETLLGSRDRAELAGDDE